MGPIASRPHGVILAAGGSTRMGTNKALLSFRGQPLVAAHCVAMAPFVDRLVVVVGANATQVRGAIPAGVEVVENADWASSWPIDSLRCALRHLAPSRPTLVTPVDTQPASADLLQRIFDRGAPAVPMAPNGGRGHPVLLSVDLIQNVLDAPCDGGLRTVLADVPAFTVSDPEVALDFDDPIAWQRFNARVIARRRS